MHTSLFALKTVGVLATGNSLHHYCKWLHQNEPSKQKQKTPTDAT